MEPCTQGTRGTTQGARGTTQGTRGTTQGAYSTGYPDSSSAHGLHAMHHAMVCHGMSCHVMLFDTFYFGFQPCFGLAANTCCKPMGLCKPRAKNVFINLKIGGYLGTHSSWLLQGRSRWAIFGAASTKSDAVHVQCKCSPLGHTFD